MKNHEMKTGQEQTHALSDAELSQTQGGTPVRFIPPATTTPPGATSPLTVIELALRNRHCWLPIIPRR